MIGQSTAADVRLALLAGQELALIDVREEAEFALGHPLFAAQIPLRLIETEALWKIPRLSTQLIVYDDGEGLADQAASILQALGYSHVSVLAGGLTGWRSAGMELFEDVNSCAKAFGEFVAYHRHTPALSASQVSALIEAKANIAVIDVRQPDEYAIRSIPTGRNVPGGELIMQTRAIVPDPETTIVVNCAGRTRGIIAAQSLINARVPNPVFTLEDGTIGWALAGLTLDAGQCRSADQGVAANCEESLEPARDVARRAGVKRMSWTDLNALAADPSRTMYLYDVRPAENYEAGHCPGFRNAPGGQLVLEIDRYAPVRGARIILTSGNGPQADMAASWLAQMGWPTYVLEDDPIAATQTGTDGSPPPRGTAGGHRRSYGQSDSRNAALQAYLDWQHGLLQQLANDGTHGFFVI